MSTVPRITTAAALLGGLCWTVKSVVITARDGSFDPLESVVFIAGLLGIAAACVLLAAHLGRRARGAARVALTAGAAVGLLVLSGLLMAAGDGVAGALYDGGNLGLQEEGGVAAAGVAWLAFGIAAVRARTDRAPTLAARSA